MFHELGADSGIIGVGLNLADECRGLDGERTDIVRQRNKRVELVAIELHPSKDRRDCSGELGNIGIEKRVSLRLCDFLAGGDIFPGVAVADCENSGRATVGCKPTAFPRLNFFLIAVESCMMIYLFGMLRFSLRYSNLHLYR